MIVEQLRQHYTKVVVGAEPVFREMRSRDGHALGVFEWPAGTSRLGVHFYASAGASEYGPEARDHAVELFVGVKPGDHAVLEGFADMALSVLKSGTVPRHGVFVAGDWKVIKGRDFTGWVLTERLDDLVPQLDLPEGRHVVFLDALPVFWEEAEYRHGNRADDLFEIWEAEEVKSWDLDRSLPAAIQPRPAGPAAWIGRALGKAKRR